ncbi:hypothetical protein EDD18DRAFT_1361964 [Armillaria luteobubalina]|uniref:Uncharacterized protein n=1 Tax=Armillaria luteobubalina TaxID=153913 RepID=A0AA39PH03_9AGAR|nr:hypothetical protein EDD18DRAFT_1361964 [Armillaria luteobubalina]
MLCGLKRHKTTCKRNLDEQRDNELYEQQLFRIVQTNVRIPSGNDISTANNEHQLIPDRNPELIHNPALNNDIAGHPDTDDDTAASLPETHEESVCGTSEYECDDIRTVYHPFSGRLTQIVHFEDYRSSSTFQHLAEFILDAALTEKQMKTLFELLNPEAASNRSTEFNIRSPKDFKEHWNRAVNLITPFEKSTVTVQLQNKDYTYDIYRRNLWEWALELIRNPVLEPHFVWDAVQLSKWNGDAFEKFVDEPWMVQAFWDLQTALPGGAKVFCFIIYADKTRLSSFSTAQAYPVVTCCGNLPIEIQNGNSVGGGRVVGWLPVIKEEAKFKKKVYYIDFKRRVWHAAFKYIIEPLFVPSRIGGWVHLSLVNTDIQMFPRLPIKSCDYDEVNFIVLIRGINGLKPCIICLVLKLEQYNLDIRYELWTKHQTQEILADAAAILTKGARNKFLSGFGLRNIENVFWNIEECDPFCSLSFDPLHAHDNGLFGDHLRGELISQIGALGGESVGQADDQIKLFPRWRNLYHFESSFMAVHFADGTKYEDLSKHIMFVTHNILTEDNDEHGYHLLKCVRSYVELRMYAGFNLHTECSIQAIRDELLKISALIRQIDLHEEQLKTPDNDELKEDTSKVSEYSGKVTLHGHCGKGGGVFKIREIRDLRADDPAFHGFQTCLSEFMIQQFRKYPDIIPEVDGEKVSFKSFKPDEEIQLYGLLKVNYKNMIDWTTSTDYLRCSLNFYNHPRYNYVLVDSMEHLFFTQLIMIFTCVISGKSFPLTLVQPFNQPVNTATEQLDKDLGFYRVCARKRSDSLFVSVYMTIWGALLVEDFGGNATDGSKEYLIIDYINSNSFLRMKSLQYAGRHD